MGASKSFGPSGPPDYSRRAKGSAGAPSGSAAAQRSTRFRTAPPCGADRDRTDDLRLAKPALSQLSYSPVVVVRVSRLLGGPGQS